MPPAGPHASFSFLTLSTLLGVMALSGATFWLLVRRATSHRQWVALSDWGRARGFRHRPIEESGSLPEPFASIPAPPPVLRLWLSGKSSQLLQMQSGHETTAARAPSEIPSWNVLILHLDVTWPPTALRPTQITLSTALDQFPLTSFPSMISSERFVIFGADSGAAKVIAKSSVPALLPPDVGLMLHGKLLVLDFSTRPFDTIEFDRMLALGKHIASHLPKN
jgi:hypothetical protein